MKTKEEIWNALAEAERRARVSRFGRFARSPLLYPSLMVFNKALYPLVHKGIYVMAHPFFGLPMRTLLPAGTDLMLNQIKSHDSEIRLAKFLCLELKPGDVFIDVGAHYGYYSLLASALVENGTVYSFEASSSSFEILKENTDAQKNIHVYHSAAGEKKGKIVFYEFPGPYAEYNTTVEDAYEKQPWLKKIEQRITTVPVIMLDDIFGREGIKKAVVKIDVEGGEASVIRGLKNALAEKDLTFAMEYLSATDEHKLHRKAADLLRDAGYKSFAIQLDGSLKEVTDIDQHLVASKINSDNIVFKK